MTSYYARGKAAFLCQCDTC